MKVLQQRLAEEGSEVEEPSLTSESNQAAMEAIFSSHYPDTELETVKDRFTENQVKHPMKRNSMRWPIATT